MDCEFTEKVSLLIDDELAPKEVAPLQTHLESCDVCRNAQTAFLEMRQQIGADEIDPLPFAAQRTLREILSSRSQPLWKRRILVPMPALAVLVVALLGLAIWLMTLQSPRAPGGQVSVKPSRVDPKQIGGTGFDLTRFDRGDRAAIEKIKRVEKNTIPE